MSRRNLTIIENSGFIKRFIEVCGSSQPVEVSQLLSISYQAATNYLNGRLPEARVLLIISRLTPYSIHWLLTGEGKKFVEDKQTRDTRILTDEMKILVREICTEVMDELAIVPSKNSQGRTVVLTSDDIKSEKVLGEINTFSEKEN